MIHLLVLIVYTKFEDSGTRTDMMENFIGKKEKWTNKGTDKQYVADSLIHNTIQLIIPNVCTEFQNPGSSSY